MMSLKYRDSYFSKVGRFTLLTLLFVAVINNSSFSQTTFKVNFLGDLEVSKAGVDSHFFFNEVDKDNSDLRLGLSQINLMTQFNFGTQWVFNSRLLVERDHGKEFGKLVVPQLNIQWLSKNRKTGVTIGSFINPFGSFNKKQLSVNRNFIGLPLAYSYYNNISERLGFVKGLGDISKIPLEGEVQWGRTNLYYGGYTTGVLFSWNIKPAKVIWKLALVNGASNMQIRFSDPIHFGIISRVKIQPVYFWEQGFSVSYGTFLQASEFDYQLPDLRAFSQTLIGTDYKFGAGHFELSGEIIGAFYTVPQFNNQSELFDSGVDGNGVGLRNLAVNLDIKYEPSALQGSFVAYRIDHLRFSELEAGQNQNWDENVLRHSFAIGYHITRNLLARATVATQQVDTKEWGETQRTFRFVLTAHY
jgi:hypothetical protein